MLQNIRIVLVETSHNGNIGSAARAMKTMGLKDLYLVSPKNELNDEAIALAAGAKEIINRAVLVNNFQQAIADCSLVIGTSARNRTFAIGEINPRQSGKEIVKHANFGQVAVVFGRERIGLTNEELLKCHYHVAIPANPHYSSLNLAMAVQLMCYEIRMNWLELCAQKEDIAVKEANIYPDIVQLEYFFDQTEQLYNNLGFIKNKGIMAKLRCLYGRAKLERNELNILQGMLNAVNANLGNKKDLT